MADLEKTVKVLFLGEDQISKTIGDIGSKINSFSSTVESIANPLAGVADGILKADAALAAFAVGGLAYAFDKAKTFESSVIELQKVLGSTESADVAIQSAKDLSNTYGQSANDILGATAGFKQAGYSIKDSLTLTKDSLDLVIAGNIDAAESSGLIIAALKGFGEEADQARRFIDILNSVSNNYATDVEQLAQGMAGLSPIASQMGFTMEETAGILTPVIEIFRSGDEAAVALKTGLLKLVDNAKPVNDALKSIGVSQLDANGELRSGKDIMLDVAKAFVGMNDNQKLFVTQQLVGIEQSARMVKVFDNLKLSTEITATAMGSAGSAAEEVAKRLQSAEVAVERFKVGWENLAVAIGDQFKAATVEAISGGSELERVLSQLVDDGTFKPIFDAINEFASGIGSTLLKIAKALPEAFDKVDFDGLIESLRGVWVSVQGLFEGIDLTTPEGLAEAIQSVVDTITSLSNVTSGMIDGFKPFFDAIRGGIVSFNKLDTESQKSSGNIFAMAESVKIAGLKVVAAILVISDTADQLAPAFEVAINTISGAFDAVRTVWNGLGLAFIEILDDIFAATAVFDRVVLFGKFSDDIQLARDGLSLWKDDLRADMYSAAESATKHLTGISVDFDGMGKSAKTSESSISTSMVAAGKSMEEAQAKAEKMFESIPAKKETTLTAKVDEARVKEAINYIDVLLPDGTVKRFEVEATANKESAKKAAQDIDKELDPIKALEIKANVDIEKIKAITDILSTSIEWEAKIDIAQIEADAEVAKAAFESIGESVAATADAVASMFGDISDYSGSHFYELYDVLNKQVDVESKLADAQIKMLEARAEAYRNGTAGQVIVQGGQLEPGAKVFMEEVLKYVQMQVFDSGDSLLLGTPTS